MMNKNAFNVVVTDSSFLVKKCKNALNFSLLSSCSVAF